MLWLKWKHKEKHNMTDIKGAIRGYWTPQRVLTATAIKFSFVSVWWAEKAHTHAASTLAGQRHLQTHAQLWAPADNNWVSGLLRSGIAWLLEIRPRSPKEFGHDAAKLAVIFSDWQNSEIRFCERIQFVPPGARNPNFPSAARQSWILAIFRPATGQLEGKGGRTVGKLGDSTRRSSSSSMLCRAPFRPAWSRSPRLLQDLLCPTVPLPRGEECSNNAVEFFGSSGIAHYGNIV